MLRSSVSLATATDHLAFTQFTNSSPVTALSWTGLRQSQSFIPGTIDARNTPRMGCQSNYKSPPSVFVKWEENRNPQENLTWTPGDCAKLYKDCIPSTAKHSSDQKGHVFKPYNTKPFICTALDTGGCVVRYWTVR